MPPTMLLDSLQTLRRKVKVFGVLFGAGLVVACAVTLLLVTVLLDYALNLPAIPRFIVILAALATLGYALVRWVVKPALAKLSLGDLAGRLETAFPQFDDRLRSTVDFAQGQRIPGSEGMKLRVMNEATQLAQAVDLHSAIYTRPVWYSASAAGGALLLIALLISLAGSQFLGIAASRLFNPFNARSWPKSVQIGLFDMPQRVAVGDPIPVKVQLLKGNARKVIISYRYDNGPWLQEQMTRGEGGAFTASLDSKIDPSKSQGLLEAKIEAGDDEKAMPPVTMVPRLDVSHIEAQITAPAYAGQAKSTVVLSERPAVLVAGSDVDIVVDFNKPLDPKQPLVLVPAKVEPKAAPDRPSTQPAPPVAPPQVNWERVSGTRAVAHLKAASSVRFSVRASDTDGFTNSNSQEYELIVREDALPVVQIEEPRRNEDRTPNAEFDLKAAADDDFGIDQAQLVVRRVSDKDGAAKTNAPGNEWVINLVQGGKAVDAPGVGWAPAEEKAERRRFRLEYHWKLEALNAALKPGDVLEYFVQVKDNFNLDGKQHPFVPSGKLRINVISQEQWATIVQQTIERVHQELTQVRQGQVRTRQDTDTLAQGAKERGKFDEADKTAAERLATQQGTTASQTVQTAQKLSELVRKMQENHSPDGGIKQAAQEVARQLDQTADGPMKEAAKQINDAKDKAADPKAKPEELKENAEQRAGELGKASANQQQAADRLDAAMKKLGDFSTLSEMIAKWQEIQKEQARIAKEFADATKNALGKTPEQMSKEEREKLKDLSRQQENLKQRAEAALGEMQKKAEQSSKSDAPTSQSMKSAAQAGQSVPSQQQQSAQSMQQNQQAQAQNAQKQIDLGIEMILQKLKEAERRKLEELAKQLEDVQKLLEDLLRRQAGHNLDNLAIQDPKKIEKMDSTLREDLLTLSNRQADKMPPAPTVQQLSASQEQTERNARDVAKTAESLPDPAPAGKLTEAAGHMERAIVHLRESKLPEAYDPPQVEALKALADAKEAVDKELNEAREKMKTEDEESVKAAYVKLLERQKKLDEEVATIDSTPKDAVGALPRETAVRLGQLPGVQGELSGTAAQLGEKLSQLKSIVFVWANKDIVKSMDEVKDDLARPETGKPTQAEQKRIEEQLQAMINSLAVKQPKPDKFADRSGGGGGNPAGGKKPPMMPTEAELRLLKELQQAINKSTQAIDAEKVKDDQKLLALGGRQGELRGLLDKLLQQASQGKVKLGEEPKNKDQLPEEASAQDIDDEEFDKELRNDEVGEDTVTKNVKLTGDRMARSRQRLALNNDPGKTTQEIQKRIVLDIDQLMQLAQKQAQQQMASGKPGQGQKPGQPKPGQAPGQQQVADGTKPGQQKTGQGGSTPAGSETPGAGSDATAKLDRDIKAHAAEWGGITARIRDAVIEGNSETVIRKYEKLVDDYYRTLSTKAAER